MGPLTRYLERIPLARATGPTVEGEALVSAGGFSPRYDLDRWTGVVTRRGHDLEGASLADKICFFVAAKGGIAAGWAFYDLKTKGIAPRAFVFGEVNPVMVQGAIFAGLTLAAGWDSALPSRLATGAWVRVDTVHPAIEVLEPAPGERACTS
jgi:predicted aconitase with swiveling domain